MRYAVLASAIYVAGSYAAFAQTPPSAETTAGPIIERNVLVLRKFYPPSSLRRGEEGQVGFKLIVNKRGRLDACQVTKSSGYAALDKATCDMMLAGATGQIYRNGDDRRVAYQRDGLVDWALPQGVAKPAVKPAFNVASASNGEAVICRRQQKTGSLVDQKVCLTRDDWKRQEAYAQEETQKMQAPRGPEGL